MRITKGYARLTEYDFAVDEGEEKSSSQEKFSNKTHKIISYVLQDC